MTLALGHRSVAEAQSCIDSREFAEWMAFSQVHPFGDERADWRSGLIAATVANVFRGKQRAFRPEDFMPRFGPLRATKTAAQIESEIMVWVRIHNKQILDKKVM